MIPISIEKFADMTARQNRDINKRELAEALKATLKAKKNGEKCCQCGSTIWAAGSAVTGMNMCFTCITLETDDNQDYEVV